MFRIECFVDDRKLAAALHALAGIVRGAPEVYPVTNLSEEDESETDEANGKANGKSKSGKKPFRAATSGNLGEMFAAYLRKNRPTEINCEYARNFLKKAGASPTSYSYVLGQAKKMGAIKKTPGTKGTGSMYTVTINDAK